jgi:hypothetical protein
MQHLARKLVRVELVHYPQIIFLVMKTRHEVRIALVKELKMYLLVDTVNIRHRQPSAPRTSYLHVLLTAMYSLRQHTTTRLHV